jgi:orotidine-5'-phosphate decarboxylase
MPPLEPRDRVIFALDVEDEARARSLVAALAPSVATFKVGLELLMRGGVDLAARLTDGAGLFIDAKLHDVPATVARSARQVVRGGVPVRYLTVHNAVREAVDAVEGKAGVLLVTVLTSVDPADFGGAAALTAHVVERARMAAREGAVGVVCAPTEAAAVRAAVGEGLEIITPGVRPAWAAVAGDDQRRVATAAEAIRAGATRLVIGRPLRDAPDPAAAARLLLDEIRAAE